MSKSGGKDREQPVNLEAQKQKQQATNQHQLMAPVKMPFVCTGPQAMAAALYSKQLEESTTPRYSK